MCISLIQSNFTSIGSGVHVGEWGINLHNRGASFSLDPSHCNVIAPSKLPMHTLIPAMVLRDGQPEYVFGTMGGHVQAQIHLQVLTRLLHDGDDPLQAVSAPRFAVDPANGGVGLEARFDANWVDELDAAWSSRARHARYDDGAGHAHAIHRLSPGWAIGSDPRAESATAGI